MVANKALSFVCVELLLELWHVLDPPQGLLQHPSVQFYPALSRLVHSQEKIYHRLTEGVPEVVVVVALNRCDELWQRSHECFIIFLQLGVVSDAATVLHANDIAHGVVQLDQHVEECRLEVHLHDALGDAKLLELFEQRAVADHLLAKVRSVKGVDAVRPYDAALNLYLAEHGVVDRLAGEDVGALDCLPCEVEEIVRERGETLLDELEDLGVFELLPGLLVGFDIVVDKDGLELGG